MSNLFIQRLTAKGYVFFGYYDLLALNASERRHLCLSVPFDDRIPSSEDKADICFIEKQVVYKVAETKAWNFQQGCFLQWLPGSDDEIIYNDFDGEKYICVILNVNTGTKRVIGYPIANISPDGIHALSFNFSRLYDYRPGYGYANLSDNSKGITAPDNDGIFLINLITGEIRLLVSYLRLWEIFPSNKNREKKLVINHVNFNTDGSKFIFLLRCFVESSPSITLAGVSDFYGNNIISLIDYGMASHYHWKDSDKLVIYANFNNKNGLFEVDSTTCKYEEIDSSFFLEDGHCSYSPCRRYLLYDSYPVNNYRKLFLYDLHRRLGIVLGDFYSNDSSKPVDCRCDLHPRWSPQGDYISFDSVHEGVRNIYQIKSKEAIQYLNSYHSFYGKILRAVKRAIKVEVKLYGFCK